MFSIYTSCYNLESGLFDWERTLTQFSDWAEEVVIGTTSYSIDNTVNILKSYCSDKSKTRLVVTDFPLNSPTFDGDIKNAALQQTTQPAKILLDLDETVPLSQKHLWVKYWNLLENSNYECLLIPSVNLCGSMETYKDIAYKFYLHKGGLKRGVWKHARKANGAIDITKSDSTEILTDSNDLAKCCSLPNDIETLRKGETPYVLHKWAVNFDTRIGQNQFWRPIWRCRAQEEVNDIILDKSALEKIPVFEHKLKIT